MKKMKIKLQTPEKITEFVGICSKYNCDINIYDGSIMVDAKSIIGVFAITTGKIIEVQAVTPDESVISGFTEDMKKFEVKKIKRKGEKEYENNRTRL